MGRLIWLFLFLILYLLQYQVPSASSSASSFSFSSSTSTHHLCPRDQMSALLQFKHMFTINSSASWRCDYFGTPPYPKTASWNETSTTNCCLWDGVTCDGLTGHVIGLDLSCSQLYGTIHPNSSSLFRLSHLQQLNLAFNDFNRSHVSSRFGQFASLTHLNLSCSSFSGSIPSEISHLSKLVSLDLSSSKTVLLNFFWDALPTLEAHNFKMILKNLTQLQQLILSEVNISSSVLPGDSLMNLSSLTTLDLGGTGLQGNLPDNIFFHLPKLQHLYLNQNVNLTGAFPKVNKSSGGSSLLRTLDLSGTSLSGELPVDSIGCLKSLNSLRLYNCKFWGSIPSVLGNLTQINELDLSKNRFNGQVPSTLSNLKQLTDLQLTFNNLEGQIPDTLAELVKLEYLEFSYNSFKGQFPSWVANLTQLWFLGTSNNSGLTGPLPSNISGLQNLQVLYSSHSSLNGTIPSWLFTLPSLVDIELNSNQLTDQIPEFQHKSPLEFIYLGNNELHGPIPPSISNLVNLNLLDLSSNNLSGVVELHIFSNFKKLFTLELFHNSLSISIGSNTNTTFPNLGLLDLSENRLSISTGSDTNINLPSLDALILSSCNIIEFPDFFRNSKNLTTLDLSNNSIHGHIPKWVGEASFLSFLDLSHNYLQGPLPIPPLSMRFLVISHNEFVEDIPSSICNLSSLQILVLSHNNLSGVIPQCLGNLSHSLSVLDLRLNDLHGTIPTTFAKGNQLRNLDLNGNKLEGSLPRALVNCRHMEVLDLGRNKLNDTIPHWLESLPELQVLILQSNRFHGPICPSRTKSPFPKLRIIDLSHNEFTGPLPVRYFRNFKAMRNVEETQTGLDYMGDSYYRDSVELVMKGVELELVRILTVFTIIDFSCNQFKGEIPNVIGSLHSLRLLNLSHNSLTGHIPPFLGNLTLLESLDLSSNQLVGEIPEQLTSLTFLEVLNLSWNHLVGPIPRSRQFDTFENGSYDGNSALCGFPLSKECGANEASQQQPLPMLQPEDYSDFVNGFTWKAIVMGYGCGMVFGLVVGYLIFVTGRPELFIRVVEEELLQKAKKTNKIGYQRYGRRN